MSRYHKHGMLFAVIIYVLWVVAYAYFDFKFEKKRLYQTIDKRLEYAALITPVLLPENFHHKDLAKGGGDTSARFQQYLEII